nr:hypothetical protein [Propionibacterium sp.]
MSDRYGLGLIRVLPDFSGDQSSELFVRVGDRGPEAGRVDRFAFLPDSRVVDRGSLAGAFPGGRYLLTGASPEGDAALRSWLASRGVSATWVEADPAAFGRLLGAQPALLTSLAALGGLVLALSLYWLTVRARSRALRVLGGVPVARIQLEDGAQHALLTTGGALVGLVLLSVAVGFFEGWAFVPVMATVQAAFSLALVGVSAGGTAVLMATAWPTAEALAHRTDPVARLRTATSLLMLTTFLVTLFALGPAARGLDQSRRLADQQATWRRLADQVVLVLDVPPGEEGALSPGLRRVLGESDAKGDLAFSYGWRAGEDQAVAPTVDGYDAIGFVNQRWLDVTGRGITGPDRAASGAPPEAVAALRSWLDPNLAIWLADGATPVERWWSKCAVLSVEGPDAVVLSKAGGGELVFPRRALVIVVPEVATTFNDDFLLSVASTRNITLPELDPTQRAVRAAGLADKVQVRFAAQDGVLLAQYVAFEALMLATSLAALVVAFLVSAFISALITATLGARAGFIRRTTGRPWARIVLPRLTTPLLLGVGIGGTVSAVTARDSRPWVVAAVLLGGFAVTVFTWGSAVHAFRRAVRRTL